MAAKKHNAKPVRTAAAASASKVQRAANSAREAPASTGRGGNGAFHDLIAEAAYYKAARRGFAPGLELQDWLEAEQEMHEPGGHSA
jgi:hypothetical protein